MSNFNAIEQLDLFTEAGFSDEQAKVQVRALQLVKEDIESNLATKKDLEHTRAALEEKNEVTRAEIGHTRAALEEKIEVTRAAMEERIAKSELQLKHDLSLRMVYIALGSVGILSALMTYLKFFAS